MAILKKPYEISIWADKLDTISNCYKEERIAVIGTDTMTSPNKAFLPILTQNMNGEITFSFSIAYKYFDPVTDLEVINPFIGYLINERKVKLHYDNKWYDFIIINHEEDSESMVWQYTATNALVRELSKNGYNIEFSTDLNNNQGTARELAEKTLKNTDWTVDTCDTLIQRVNEPMIVAHVQIQGLSVIEVESEETTVIPINETVYVFYSYIANKNNKFVQLMRESDRSKFIIDDNGNIVGPNYRILNDVTYTVVNDKVTRFDVGGARVSLVTFDNDGPQYTYAQNQGYRIVYGPLTTYDPVMEKTVERYSMGSDNNKIEIYKFSDTTYTSSDVVTSYISNGSNFNVFEDGSLQGWKNTTACSAKEEDGVTSKFQHIDLTTYPNLGIGTSLIPLTSLTRIEGYLELKFDGVLNSQFENTFFNSGFNDNAGLIDHISNGEKYLFRIAAAKSNQKHGALVPYHGVRALVAYYTSNEDTSVIAQTKKYEYTIEPNGIILDFDGEFECQNVEINNGVFSYEDEDDPSRCTSYVINGIVEEPVTNVVYVEGNEKRVWDPLTYSYVLKNLKSDFIDYYSVVAEAKQSVTQAKLSDPSTKIGIFLYTKDNTLTAENVYTYISDVQLTKCIYDNSNPPKPITIGNIPTAAINTIDTYYVKPKENASKTDIDVYYDLDSIAKLYGGKGSDITPIYNESSEKILSINEKQSNCFNILQTICETFECWLDIHVNHTEDGAIIPGSKKVSLKQFVGKDNFAGFKYSINLNSIQRTLNSEEIVTKLLVENTQNDHLDSGIMSIRDAKSNPNGESYILNFDYYINKKLIENGEECRKDLANYDAIMKAYNNQLNTLNKQKSQMEISLNKMRAQRNVYVELIDTAKDTYNEGLQEFLDATGIDYNEYVNKYGVINTIAADAPSVPGPSHQTFIINTNNPTPVNTSSYVYTNNGYGFGMYQGKYYRANQYLQDYQVAKGKFNGLIKWFDKIPILPDIDKPNKYITNLAEWDGAVWNNILNTTSENGYNTPSDERWAAAWNNRNSSDHGASSLIPPASIIESTYGYGYFQKGNYLAIEVTYEYGEDTYGTYRLYEWDEEIKQWVIRYSDGDADNEGVPPSDASDYYLPWKSAWPNRVRSDHGEGLLEDGDLSKQEAIINIVGKIYTASSVINNYTGILTNLTQEYEKLKLILKGREDYSFSAGLTKVEHPDTADDYKTTIVFNDYLEGVKFKVYQSGINIEVEEEVTVSKKDFTYIDSIPFDRIVITDLPKRKQNGADIIAYTIKDSSNNVIALNTPIELINGIKQFKLEAIHDVDGNNQPIDNGLETQVDTILQAKEEKEKEFFTKYSYYIKEGTWSSNDYIDSELYYLDALQVSKTSSMPKVEYTINVVEVSELEGLENYIFNVGDKTYIEDTEFFGWHKDGNGILSPAREEVIVSQVEWHLDEPETNVVTVQNYKTQFEDLFQRISAAVQTVQYNEATYAKTSTLLDADGTLNQNVLLASLNNIGGKSYSLTSDGSIVIDKDTILIRDLQNLTNSQNIVKIDSRGISISSNAGNDWAVALDGKGLNAGLIYVGDLNTDKITITGNNNPSFRWDRYGISAYRQYDEDLPYDLSTYVRLDQYGLYGIKKDQDYKATSLEDVKNKAFFGITWDGFFIKNSYTGGGTVQITSENDFQVFNSNQTEKIKIGALEWEQNGVTTTIPIDGEKPSLYGIRIQNDAGQTVFKTGDNGNLEITGTIYATAGEIGGMIVNDDSLTMDTIVLEPGVGIYSTVQIDNHNAFHISDTDGSAIFRYIEALGGKLGNLNVIDTITVGQGNVSGNIRSANYVANTSGWVIDSTGYAEFANAKVRGHIDANSGTLNNLSITGGITVAQNGYIQSSNWNNTTNNGWQITDTGATFNNVTVRGHVEASTGTLGNLSVIDTITVGANGAIQSSDWNEINHTGWNINNAKATFNNADVRGTITALQGDFLGEVRVGPTDQGQDHIIIDGTRAAIKSSNYQDGAGYGWMINKDGDAVFNNITARGAIKTAVFEYSEIQAVGGIFIFRPSSTIRSAAISGNNLVLKVEKPFLFAKITYDEIENPSGNPQTQGWYEISQESFSYVLTEDTEVVVNKTYYNRTVIGHSWCKISNYTSDGREPNISSILATNGLTHVYEVGTVNLSTREVTLLGAKAFVDAVKQSGETDDDVLAALEGGALVDMGRESNNADYDSGKHNYGIGVNSSDNTVNLPARAISLFETVIDRTRSPKVSYDYKGILGTLPELSTSEVSDTIYNQRMAGTQGIFTNNMYIGDARQYIAFYEDEHGDKQLRIKANQIVYEITDPEPGQDPWQDIADIAAEGVPGPQGPPGEDAIQVKIESNIGNNFVFGNREAILSCYVFKGITDITSQVTQFDWTKVDKDGNVDDNWIPDKQGIEDGLLVNQISINTDDVDLKSVFYCNVTFA